jgi:hypothetical protein
MRIWRKLSNITLIIVLLTISFFIGVFEGFSYASYGAITVGKWVGEGHNYRDGILELYFLAIVVLLGYFLSKHVKKEFYQKTLGVSCLIISLFIFIGLISVKFTVVEKITELPYLVKDAQPNLVKYVALISKSITIDWVLFSLILLTVLFEVIQYFISKEKEKI